MKAIVPKRESKSCPRLCWLLLLPLLLLVVPPSFAQDTVVTLTLARLPIVASPPVTESFIVTMPFPPASPTAVLILLPGGNGDIHLTPVGSDGTLSINSDNFLTRDRGLFAGHNFIVITLDAASDYLMTADVLKFHQGDADHISDVEAVIQWARTSYSLPVWLVGTSRGTAGAFVAASAASPTGPDGLVFSSAINNTTDPDSLLMATREARFIKSSRNHEEGLSGKRVSFGGVFFARSRRVNIRHSGNYLPGFAEVHTVGNGV